MIPYSAQVPSVVANHVISVCPHLQQWLVTQDMSRSGACSVNPLVSWVFLSEVLAKKDGDVFRAFFVLVLCSCVYVCVY